MVNSKANTPGENNSAHCKTIFKQTFKFTKNIPEQRISPDGFLIRDCGCVMRFLPNLDNKLSKYVTTTNVLFIEIKLCYLFIR